MTSLLLFVHGFKGSSHSFESFPPDLQSGSLINPDVKMYEYDTQGDNNEHADKLAAFLIHQAYDTKYTFVFLIGHSMGGLLAIDAVRRLSNTGQATFQPDPKTHMWEIKSSLSATNMKLNVNIAGILSFDSPYFGVNYTVGTSRIKNMRDRFFSHWNDSSGIQTDSSRKESHQKEAKDERSDTHDSMSVSSSTFFGVATAAVVAGSLAYHSSETIRRHSESARKHYDFLNPLFDTKNIHERLESMKMMIKEGLSFHCIYIQVVDQDQKQETFISPPPEEISSLFSPVQFNSASSTSSLRPSTSLLQIAADLISKPSNRVDPIDCHMSMFSRPFDPKAYTQILELATTFIHKIVFSN